MSGSSEDTVKSAIYGENTGSRICHEILPRPEKRLQRFRFQASPKMFLLDKVFKTAASLMVRGAKTLLHHLLS